MSSLPRASQKGVVVVVVGVAAWLRFLAKLMAVALTGVIFLRATVDAQDTYELRGAVSRWATPAHWRGRAGAQEVLPMSLTLSLRHRVELATLLAAQRHPSAPQFHRWLTPAQFAKRFGPSASEYARLTQWLTRQGFRVSTWPDRLRIDFRGSVANAERSFGVKLSRYRRLGRDYIANAGPPRLPLDFEPTISFLRLDTFPVAHPLVEVRISNGSMNAMAPQDMYAAYDVTPLLDRGIDGSGQTIAVVARSDFDDSDVIQFRQQFDVPVLNPLKAFPAGNPGIGAVNGVCGGISDRQQQAACILGEEVEVLLDTEWVGAMAPGATVLVDIADTDVDASLADIVNHHPEAKIISMSFGACERSNGADRMLFAPLYAQAAAQGQTVLVATGDFGADECRDGGAASVNVLATDANVTAVGGTALDPGFDAMGKATGYVSETAWNDASGASGGGPSKLVSKPAYQDAPGVPADGARDIPDVSLLASVQEPGYVMIYRRGEQIVGGTSVGAPSWAGFVALLADANGTAGLGGLNEILYKLGRKQYTGQGLLVFHDIIAGDNSFDAVQGYAAGTGFDLVTGLGTPDVNRLAQALAGPSCVGDCNGDGAVTVNELLTGVAIALGEQPLSVCSVFDTNGDGQVTVNELLEATNRALSGCGS